MTNSFEAESFEAKGGYVRKEKYIYHECYKCGYTTEPTLMVRMQDRKCPKCKDEYWSHVQTMFAFEDWEKTRALRKKEMLEKYPNRKDFIEKLFNAESKNDEKEQAKKIPNNISNLMRAFEDSGFSILIVGGAVRDSLLGKSPKDYDLATNAKPDEIKQVVKNLKGYRYVLGPQAEKSLVNLTSLVTVPNEVEAVEITTYRKELGYAGGRTKGIFEPADTFEEDAQRRDLTINAMGMDVDGEIIDPMNGQKDLQDGVIRAVGDPTQRFVEDPLRMIRAIRFSVRLGLPIEENTYQAIVSNADLVNTLSGRRLRDEIGKVLIEPNGYKLLMETGVLPVLMPEFRGMEEYHHKLDYHPEDTLYNHYIEAFKTFTKISNRSELGAWALLFHDIAKPQTAVWNEEYHTFYGHDKQGGLLVLENYNNTDGPFEFSKKELQKIAWTTDNHLGKFWEMKKPTKVAKMRNNENYPLLVEVVTGDTMGIRRGGDEALAARLIEIDEITNKINEQEAKTGNRPKDFAQKLIKELGVQGQEISIALNEIEELVSTGQVQSYDEGLEVLKTKRQNKNAESLLTRLNSKTSMDAEENNSPYYLKTVTFEKGYAFKKFGHPEGGLNSSEIFIREGIFTSREDANADLQKTLMVIDNLTVIHNAGKNIFARRNINNKGNETGWRSYSRLGEKYPPYNPFGNPEKPVKYIWDNNLNINGYRFDDEIGRWYVEYKQLNMLGS